MKNENPGKRPDTIRLRPDHLAWLSAEAKKGGRSLEDQLAAVLSTQKGITEDADYYVKADRKVRKLGQTNSGLAKPDH